MLEDYQMQQIEIGEESWREKWRKVFAGLKAPKDSGEYKWAVFEMQRFFSSSSVSTAVCVAVLLLLLLFVGISRNLAPPTLDVVMVDPETEELEEIIEDDLPEPEPVEEVVSMDPSHQLQDADVTTIVNEAPSFGDESTDDLVAQAVDIITSPMVLRGLYGARTGGGRAAAVGKHGGGGSLTAVLKALRWLKANQLEDGSWAGPSKTAMCGLALLCYMAHGETPASPEFGRTVENAIRYLLYAQGEDGRFKEAGDHYVYGHAIATYALAESYGMTKMVMLKDPVIKAVKVITGGQQAGGAWNYDYNDAGRRDMSVTSWQVQALKAAKLAGIYVDGLEEAIEKSVAGVKSFAQAGGGFGYDGVGNRPTLTGAGALCLQLVGHAQDGAVVSSLQAYADRTPAWQGDDFGTYGWYYMTQAKFQHGGAMWTKWNKTMLPMLIENQADDGHWASGTTHQACDVYDTTMACLCLEVYYRYLPTYARVEEAANKAEDAKDSKDLSIDMAL